MPTPPCPETRTAYGVSTATCAASGVDLCGAAPFAGALPPRAATPGCSRPRNVYLDLGANWCNTLTLFEIVPEVAKKGLAHAGVPWNTYAVEAAPLISPYVERCVAALSAGRPLPLPPVPPAGSSMQLLNYAVDLGCEVKGKSVRERMACVGRKLEGPLAALARSAQPSLTSNATLLRSRLAAAASRGACPSAGAARNTFDLIPAAAGAQPGMLQMVGSPLQMLRGGSNRAGGHAGGPQFDVPLVDVVSWISSSFTEDDFVVLKMDVEGAEKEIVPALLRTNTTRLVDVFLWECHLKWRGARGKCQCAAWENQLLAAGVRRVYRERYPFAPVEKKRAAAWRPL